MGRGQVGIGWRCGCFWEASEVRDVDICYYSLHAVTAEL